MTQRTTNQNSAIHLLFQMLADTLNEAGLDQRKVLKASIAIPWTKESVKSQLWKPIQEAQFDKKSTTELTTVEVDKVFDTLNRHLGEKFSVHTPFPSIEEIMFQQREKE